jgi:peptidyl-prolyl cis-trans isomerase C
MEIARQNILVQALLADYEKKNTISDADIKAEYDKFKAQASGTEYRARHILVEKEDDCEGPDRADQGRREVRGAWRRRTQRTQDRARTAAISTSPRPGAYVPEFSQAMVKLKKGEMTETPVKSQFGYHIIKLEDTRDAQFPPLEEVKGQIQQRLAQQKVAAFRDEIRAKAKTDYKFSNQ